MQKILFFLIFTIFSTACVAPNKEQKTGFTLDYARAEEARGWNSLDSIMARIQPPTFPAKEFSVLDYGAKGDSTTNDRYAFIQAINECHLQGGGKIHVPAGQYFIKGPLHLKSNIHLHLDQDARLFFSQDPLDYVPLVKVRWEGTVCYNFSPLIYAYQQNNIAITGKGIIDGAAVEWSQKWRKLQNPDKKRLRQMGNDTIPEHQRVFGFGYMDMDEDGHDDGFGDNETHYLRPTLIEFYECSNILLDGFTPN